MKKEKFKLKSTLFGISMSGMCLLFIGMLYLLFRDRVLEYLFVWFMITIFAIVMGLFMDYMDYSGRKEVCNFCKEELGNAFCDGKSRYNKYNDELWAHKRCIPNNLLRQWIKTQ